MPPGSRPKTPTNSKQGPKDMISTQEGRSLRPSSSAVGSKVNIVELLFERNLEHCVLRVFLALDGQTLKCARCVCRRWAKFISNEVQHKTISLLELPSDLNSYSFAMTNSMLDLLVYVCRCGVGHNVTWRDVFTTSGASTCLGCLEFSALPGKHSNPTWRSIPYPIPCTYITTGQHASVVGLFLQ